MLTEMYYTVRSHQTHNICIGEGDDRLVAMVNVCSTVPSQRQTSSKARGYGDYDLRLMRLSAVVLITMSF